MHRRFASLLGRVCLPVALVTTPATLWGDAPREPTYVVKEGDTLSAIAHAHHLSEESLRLVNGLEKDGTIRSGQSLTLPAPGRPAGDGRGGGPTSSSKETAGAPSARSGIVRLVRGDEVLLVRVLDRHRRLVANVLPELTHFLRSGGGSTHTIDPRLVTLLAVLSDHFLSRDIVVVSGYRPYSGRQYARHSNHNAGRAVDFAVRGIPNETVRDFCRTLHSVGVGYYPNSSFVHLDVREANAFWVDYSAAGQRPRYHRSESNDDADEAVREVDGVATVDNPAGAKTGSDMTWRTTPASAQKQNGKLVGRASLREHDVFQGQ
jgi:uncharacterized protein YcbK (DUF882 family)